MRIVVTGAAGRIGGYVVRELTPHHEVIGFDRGLPHAPVAGVRYWRGDHTDQGQIYALLRDAEAVIHLSAITNPNQDPPEVVFGRNIMGTYHVAEAAAALGLRTIVHASSINTLGFGFRTRHFNPLTFPLDETHPNAPQDPYSLSKLAGEEIMAMVHRRTGIRAISIRPPAVIHPEAYAELVPARLRDPSFGSRSLWCWIDVRDLAVGFRLAVENETLGCESLFVFAAEPMATEPLCDLLPRYYPGTEALAANLTGTTSAISIDKARRLLGYEPRYRWREHVAAAEKGRR
jgi:nucleoside-diphosphate-sugar epimerase